MNKPINTEVIETSRGSLTLTFEEEKGLYYTRILLVAKDGKMKMVKKDGAYWRDHAAEQFGANVRIAKRMEVSGGE